MEWVVTERPGYFGTSRDKIHKKYDEQFYQQNKVIEVKH